MSDTPRPRRPRVSRRQVLRTASAVAVAPAFAGPATTAARAAAPPAGPGRVPAALGAALPAPASWAVRPFPLNAVALGEGVFSRKRDLILQYARDYPADRILAVFRANAGLDTLGAQPPGGWETADGNLRGHYGGHFLTLIAQAYAGSGQSDAAFYKDKLDYLVAALGECRAALAEQGAASHPGFLAAYPETQFILLEQFTTYPTIWAPYYTCHKIMRGLLDAHTLAGNAEALDIVTGMADWVHSRLSRLPREQLDQMWSIYIAGEYGGMNEVMADLHALTGRAEYLETAHCFDNTRLLQDCAAGRDTLDGKHANQHIPQFSGYLRMYDESPAETGHRTAAENFWTMVVGPRTYSLGGAGQGEMFRARDAVAATLAENNAETCATYNMLKLTRYLFFHRPDAAYMDYYERGLLNHILASRRDTSATDSPEVTYFVGMAPGTRREFGNTGTCCGGTGMENHSKYQESVYFRAADESALYVNLFVDSALHWEEWRQKGLTVTQRTDFPYEAATRLTIEGDGPLDLKLRVPAWAVHGYDVRVNGSSQSIDASPGSYVTLSRTWRSGDVVDVQMPFGLRVERTPDDRTVQSLFYGPVLLVAQSAEQTLREFSFYRHLGLSGDLAAAVRPEGRPLHFTTHGVTLAPFHLGDEQPYHGYFRRAEPDVVFGDEDAGVPNRAGGGGETFLDEVWAGAPFATHGDFVARVRSLAAEWQAAGVYTAAEAQRIVTAAARADLGE